MNVKALFPDGAVGDMAALMSGSLVKMPEKRNSSGMGWRENHRMSDPKHCLGFAQTSTNTQKAILSHNGGHAAQWMVLLQGVAFLETGQLRPIVCGLNVAQHQIPR